MWKWPYFGFVLSKLVSALSFCFEMGVDWLKYFLRSGFWSLLWLCLPCCLFFSFLPPFMDEPSCNLLILLSLFLPSIFPRHCPFVWQTSLVRPVILSLASLCSLVCCASLNTFVMFLFLFHPTNIIDWVFDDHFPSFYSQHH